ncbi:MAG: sugar phosphate isomerase/epimerase [Sphingomonadales bacterium]|nr:sugar phosphate isomerase/epimerase [Sphingomonadales bacterium]
MNRLGIEMLTLLGMPPVDYVRLAGELGCASVSTGLTGLPLAMFGITDFAPWPMWSLIDDAALRRDFRAALTDSGVQIGLAEGFRARSDAEAAASAPAMDLFADLGAGRLNASCTEEDRARAFDQLGELAEMAAARGMTFTVEFVPGSQIGSLGDVLELIAHIGEGKCFALIDSMHFFRSGGTLAQLRALDPAVIGYVQLCDAPHTGEGPYFMEAMFARRVPGTGDLPLAEFVAALPAAVPISVEVPILADLRAGLPPRDHAARVVAAARAIGA